MYMHVLADAYRSSKAAVNMVSKSMAVDLAKKDKDGNSKGIAVLAINPGMVATDFGPGMEMMTKMGSMPVSRPCEIMLSAFDRLTMENTGSFWSVPSPGKGDVAVDFAGGW